jgi:hypothetical protein
VLVLWNLYIWVHRDDGYHFIESASYDELYGIKNDPFISSAQISGDSLTLETQGLPGGPWIINDHQGKNQRSDNIIHFRLQPGKNRYQIRNAATGTTFTTGIYFTPSGVYQHAGRKRSGVAELFCSSIRYGQPAKYAAGEWAQFDSSQSDELSKARELLTGEIGVSLNDSVQKKIRKIGSFVLSKLDHLRGIPNDSSERMAPFERFQYSSAARTRVWCGDFADALSFFLNAADVPCRLVSLEGKIGDLHKAGHVFNEAYDKDSKKWVFVDLTAGILSVRNNQGEPLNTIDFFNGWKFGPDHLSLLAWNHGSLALLNMADAGEFYRYFFDANDHFIFYKQNQFNDESWTTKAKFKRYFFGGNTFVTYGGSLTAHNNKFYLKQIAAACLCFFMVYWWLGSIMTKRRTEKPAI